MSFWISAYCHDSVASVTPEDLAEGISARLKLITYLFCSDDEEEPDEVLAPMRIEDASAGKPFDAYRIHYHERQRSPMRVDRWSDPGQVRSSIAEVDGESLAHRSERRRPAYGNSCPARRSK